MIIEYHESLYAVLEGREGKLEYFLLPEQPSFQLKHEGRLTPAATLDTLVDYLERKLTVDGVVYDIWVDHDWVRIEIDGVFFTECDWQGELTDTDAEILIREQTNYEDSTEQIIDRVLGDLVKRSLDDAPTLCPQCKGDGMINRKMGDNTLELEECPLCLGEHVVSTERDLKYLAWLNKSFDRILILEGLLWCIKENDKVVTAQSPAFEAVMFTFDYSDVVMEGIPVLDEAILSDIQTELEALRA